MADIFLSDYPNCHEDSESSHQKSNTYEQLAIFMLRGAPKAHAACCKIAIAPKTRLGR
jgi:hypothetical protein